MNKLVSILDPGCFIWDENDFFQRKTMYYDFLDDIVDLIETLELGEFNYLLRSDMLDLLTDSFPAKLITDELNKNGLNEAISLFYIFIDKISNDIIDFEELDEGVNSYPDFKRGHFDDVVKKEINYLLTTSSTYKEPLFGITLEKIWENNQVNTITLFNKNGEELRDISIITNTKKLKELIYNTELTFEPSIKHKFPRNWGTLLPDDLEKACYSLIKKAIKAPNENSEALYAYSKQYNEYIIFRLTVNNIYHAYPIHEQEVPKTIKRELQNS